MVCSTNASDNCGEKLQVKVQVFVDELRLDSKLSPATTAVIFQDALGYAHALVEKDALMLCDACVDEHGTNGCQRTGVCTHLS